MGLIERTTTADEPLSYERQGEALADGDRAKAAHLTDDGGVLDAATGVVWGVFLGGIVWAAALWVLL